MCNSLGCGEFDKKLNAKWLMEERFKVSEKMMIDCSGIINENVTNLWQCVRSAQSCLLPAVVSCTGKPPLAPTPERLLIETEQLQMIGSFQQVTINCSS